MSKKDKYAKHDHVWHRITAKPYGMVGIQMQTAILCKCDCGKLHVEIIRGVWSFAELDKPVPS